jgi:hypothetical protein
VSQYLNGKIVFAFATGALLASGIVYMAVKPDLNARPPVVAAASKPIYVNPEPAKADGTESIVATEPSKAEPERPAAKPAPPTPTRTHKAQIVQIARAGAPPLRQPINRERPVNDANRETPPAALPVAAARVPEPPVVIEKIPEPAKVEPAPEPVIERGPEPVVPHTVTLTSGTGLPVRIGESLSTNRNQPGDTFLATLDQPLVADGFVIAERGARLEGRVVAVERPGKVQGLARIEIELTKLTTSDGQRLRIHTASWSKQAQQSHGTDAAKIAGGAAIGAAIGAMAGGGKGAAIGAGAGGAAGTADVMLTRGKDAGIPVETRVTFRLEDPITLTERLR